MKISVALTSLCFLAICLCYLPGGKPQGLLPPGSDDWAYEPQLLGGWSQLELNSQTLNDALTVLKGHLGRKKYKYGNKKKIEITEARYQLVAGTNYEIKFKCLKGVRDLCRRDEICTLKFTHEPWMDPVISPSNPLPICTKVAPAPETDIIDGGMIVGAPTYLDLNLKNDQDTLEAGLNALKLTLNHDLNQYWEANKIEITEVEYQLVAGEIFTVHFSCKRSIPNLCSHRQTCSIEFYFVDWLNPKIQTLNSETNQMFGLNCY